MEIRKKILLYFSLTIISLTAVALAFIYTLVAGYYEEEFQQRQKEKIKSTLFFLTEIKKAEQELMEAIDRLTINDLYDEKLLIFNHNQELIYSSIDDTPISYSKSILKKLSPQREWYEAKEGQYDLVGLYFQNGEKTYYGISKAYDKFGHSKLNYLKTVLIFTFLIISVAVVLISYILSNKITHPLIDVAKQISNYDFGKEYSPILVKKSKNEIAILAEQFNKLMKRMSEAFEFQKHAIHHISHELKTPIAVLVSNFEMIEAETDIQKIQDFISNQKKDTKNLGEIINSLLEIAKSEAGDIAKQDNIRVDELIFDIADELRGVYPAFCFSVEYAQADDESNLILAGNPRLLRATFMNLMQNCIQYSNDHRAKITFQEAQNSIKVIFENSGAVISEKESQYLFQHFFRGENSQGKRGFGLGLVFVYKIITIHNGTVGYQASNNTNIFTVTIPLS